MKREKINRKQQLPERQRQVLEGIGRAESSKETAARLKIAVRTVEGHKRRAMRTLRAHKATEAFLRAVERGLLKRDPTEERGQRARGKSRRTRSR